MAGSAVNVTIDQLSTELERQAQKVRDFLNSDAARASKKKIALLSVAGVKEHFDKSISPEGVPWAPLRLRSGKPLLDTGRLRSTVVAGVTADGVQLSANNIQARIQQDGGVIRAKGKYLAIPLTPRARRAGSPRNLAGLHFEGKKGANKGILADKAGEPQYALVPSVKVPARPYLGWSAPTLDKISNVLATDLAKALEGI